MAVLNAHLDTVPTDESEWKTSPFDAEVEDSRVHGRDASESSDRIPADTLADKALPDGPLPEAATMNVEPILEAGPFHFLAANRHIELVRENAWQLLGEELIVHGTNEFIDAPFFAASGAKTLKYGPGDEHSNAHGPDESADMGQIAETAAVMPASVIDLGRKGNLTSQSQCRTNVNGRTSSH